MRDIYSKLLDFLDGRERRRLVLLIVLMLFMGLMETLGVGSILPFLAVLSRPGLIEENGWLSAAYQAGGFESHNDFLIALGIGVFCLLALNLVLKTLTVYAMARFTQMRGFSLSLRLFAGYLGQPYVWFLNRHSADMSTAVLGEVQQVVMGVLMPAIQLISNMIVVACLLVLVILVDPVIALTTAAVLGTVYGLLFLWVRRLLARIGAERVKANTVRFRIVQEATGGIKDVKILGLEQVLARRLEDPAYRFAHSQTVAEVVGGVPKPVMEAVLFGGMVLLVLQMMLTRPGGLSEVLPVVGLYAFAGLRLFPALQQIYFILTRLRFTKPALDALHADLREIGGAGRLPGPVPAPLGLAEQLELRDLHYTYPGAAHAALQGVNMTIQSLSTVGIVGSTGAGKTTVVDIILGLLVPQRGALAVDGREIADDAMRAAWRRSIGYVPQQIFLADESVAGNIAFGIPPGERDPAAIERAARIAELHEFVLRDLPEQYETMVGERGVRLSGGQRQRIGIARALYHDPDVLVLDEATSALDNLTERAVMDAVHNLGHAKTVIMIAHRLSTVRTCDEIFLMEKGRVIARGSYDTLLAENADFKRMAEGAS